MYKAIKNNNSEKFLQLAQLAGIQNVLWRGDVLFNDRVTTGANVENEESNLKNFPQVRLLESQGPWKLYSLSTKDNLFNTASYASLYYGSNLLLSDTIDFTNTPLTKTAWIDISQNSSKKVGIDTENIIQNDCPICDAEIEDNQSSSFILPSIRILPWSKLYFLINW